MARIDHSFFTRHPVDCARDLIGCVLVWDGCKARIVETEAYASEGDPACHTFSRPSACRFAAEHEAGAAYVYLNYGVHWLFNILVKSTGCEGFVLFRALEPLEGLERIGQRRGKRKPEEWCSGPGRLTRALGIDGTVHGEDFLEQAGRGLFHGEADRVVCGPRIGISRARDLPWRFGEAGHPHLSRKFPG